MGSFSIWHWIIVLVVVLLLFGRGKIPELMGDVAKGIKSFKKGMSDDDKDDNTTTTARKDDGAKGATVSNATINYEVNRTIRHTREQSGQLQRLSAAVVVNYPMQANAEGEMQPMPLAEEQMNQIKSLVREAMGFSAERGDSLEVINMPFTDQPDTVVEPSVPWWQDRQLISMVESAVKYLLLAIVAWIEQRGEGSLE